ncbi:hypothetical protein C2E23DRAFT_205056 [Lenzites betulinus]|nr:hypothetical protein C2E23DRAFT_205056 [Lenzites betulinus]
MLSQVPESLQNSVSTVSGPSKPETPSACFRVLACEEVLRDVLLYLTDQWTNYGPHWKTLVSMAVVCRATSPPALAMIWEHLDSFQPLLSLLESLDAVTSTPQSTDAAYSKRFHEYAKLVRSIHLRRHTDTIMPPILADCQQPLLPNLRRLFWEAEVDVQPLTLFIAPSLISLDLSIVDCPHAKHQEVLETLLDALDTAARTCPLLTSIRLLWRGTPAVVPAAYSILPALAHIVTVKTLSASLATVDSPRMIPILSKLPSLHFLYIFDSHDSLSDTPSLQPVESSSEPGFHALQRLSLRGCANMVLNFLNSMPQCNVQQCTISLQGEVSGADQTAVAARIAEKFRASLDTVALFQFGTSRRVSGEPVYALKADLPFTLRSLDLVDVRLANFDAGEITDTLFQDIAGWWPRLRVLHLEVSSPSSGFEPPPPMPAATLRGVRYLAERCPHLNELSIQVDAMDEHWADEARLFSTIRVAHTMSLNLNFSPVTCPTAVAEYLKRCFHTFSKVSFDWRMTFVWGETRDTTRAWHKLCEILLHDVER